MLGNMSTDEKPALFTTKTITIGLSVCGVVFLFFFGYLQDFVPLESPGWRAFWAGYTALCMAGVAFLAVFSFIAVFVDERFRRQRGIPDEANPPY